MRDVASESSEIVRREKSDPPNDPLPQHTLTHDDAVYCERARRGVLTARKSTFHRVDGHVFLRCQRNDRPTECARNPIQRNAHCAAKLLPKRRTSMIRRSTEGRRRQTRGTRERKLETLPEPRGDLEWLRSPSLRSRRHQHRTAIE